MPGPLRIYLHTDCSGWSLIAATILSDKCVESLTINTLILRAAAKHGHMLKMSQVEWQ